MNNKENLDTIYTSDLPKGTELIVKENKNNVLIFDEDRKVKQIQLKGGDTYEYTGNKSFDGIWLHFKKDRRLFIQ